MKNTEQRFVRVVDQTANPAPLSLLGFGMTTVLFSLHYVGLFELNAMMLAMGLVCGIAQIAAGLMAWRKGNTFTSTAFASFGLFWLSYVSLLLLPEFGVSAPDRLSMVSYLVLWGCFTLVMSLGTLRQNRAMQVFFASLTLFYFLLAVANLTEMTLARQIAGVEGLFCGLVAIYIGFAHVINEVYGEAIVPLWPVMEEKVIRLVSNCTALRQRNT